MEEQDKPRKAGRPKKYVSTKPGERGAPYLGVRLDPPVYEHIRAQPEGPRAYLERVVSEDMQRTGDAAPEQRDEK